MVGHVAVVRLEGGSDEVGLLLDQVEHVPQRHHQTPERHYLALEPEDVLLDVRVGLVGEHAVLDLLGQVLEPLDHLEVPVHDLVEERVEEEPAALGGVVRPPVPPFQYGCQVERRRVPQREQVLVPGERVDLAVDQLVLVVQGEAVQHDQEVPFEELDLGALPLVPRVLDRHGVEVELLGHQGQLVVGGVLDVQPHPGPLLLDQVADPGGIERLLLQDAALVQAAGDGHGGASVTHDFPSH